MIHLLKNFREISTTAGVVEEILRSDRSEIIDPISSSFNKWLKIHSCSDYQRILEIQRENSALSIVDSELIILCLDNEAVLLSDDTKLLSIAEEKFGVTTFDLCDMIISLKNKEKLDRDEIERIIIDLERKDRYRFSRSSLRLLRS